MFDVIDVLVGGACVAAPVATYLYVHRKPAVPVARIAAVVAKTQPAAVPAPPVAAQPSAAKGTTVSLSQEVADLVAKAEAKAASLAEEAKTATENAVSAAVAEAHQAFSELQAKYDADTAALKNALAKFGV